MKRMIMMLALLLPVAATAQETATEHWLKGIVKDLKSGERQPLVNAAVYKLEDSSFVRGATSDMEGLFNIQGIPQGTYMLRISCVGYEEWNRKVTVDRDRDLGEVLLNPSISLQTVEIVSDKPLFSMDGEKQIYSTGDDPSIQTGTASDALQNAPGIEIDADGNITLRGSQSVAVWINDRPSHMEGEALKQYIRMLPANSISKIEVISNPSARYGGGTPVVNIVTNKKIVRNDFFSFGLNGSTKPELTPWMSYVFANEKVHFNIYANLGYQHSASTSTGHDIILDPSGDTSQVSSYKTRQLSKTLNSYIGGHISYTIDSLNSIGSWFGGYPGWSSHWYESQTAWREYLGAGAGDYSNRQTNTTPLRRTPNGGGYLGAWYEHLFDDSTGHKLNLSLNASGYRTHQFCHYGRAYTFMPENDIRYVGESLYENTDLGVGADYTLPFGTRDTATGQYRNELEAGIGISHSHTGNLTLFDFAEAGLLSGKTDSLQCDNTSISDGMSLYATCLRRFGRLAVKLGLRGSLDSQHLDYALRQEYNADSAFWTLTPSLHLSYSTRDMHSFSFSYTRRVSQPGLAQLTLYKQYGIDNYGDWGNPDLRPAYSQKMELNWDKYFMKFGSVGAQLYYTNNTGQISELASVTYSTFYGHNVSYTMPMNIGSSWSGGLDLNVTCRPSAFVNVRCYATLLYNNEDFTFRGQEYHNSQWSCRLRLNAWAKLWKNCQFFVNAYLGSPTKSIFSTTDTWKGADIGANADFFERKLTVNLNLHDIFNLNSWNTSNDNPYLISSSSWQPKSRYVTLGITLRFGKMELANMAHEGPSQGEGQQ